MDFVRYSNALLSALTHSTKESELVNKKQEILDAIYEFHNFVPNSTLFVGFSPAVLSNRNGTVNITNISDEVKDYLDAHNVAYRYIPEIDLIGQQFDVVIAMDEYFTFADDDVRQQESVRQICRLAKEFVISTLRDYKNQDFKEREFSIPAVIRNGKNSVVYNEFHDWDHANRNAWATTVYEVTNPDHTLTTYGPFGRRTMYFKQLAKFSMDAGASDFIVHKNLMYKSLIKKNYEHVISIRFEEQWTYQNSSTQ